jgi:hypothetical protein
MHFLNSLFPAERIAGNVQHLAALIFHSRLAICSLTTLLNLTLFMQKKLGIWYVRTLAYRVVGDIRHLHLYDMA